MDLFEVCICDCLDLFGRFWLEWCDGERLNVFGMGFLWLVFLMSRCV